MDIYDIMISKNPSDRTHAEVGDAIYGKFHQFGCRILGVTGNPDLPVIILHPVLESHERNQTAYKQVALGIGKQGTCTVRLF